MANKRFTEDADFYMTRTEFAARAGLSVKEVKRQEALGHLMPAKRNSTNQPFYKKSQLDLFLQHRRERGGMLSDGFHAAPYTAEEAAKVFTELDKGKSEVQIVEQLKVHPRAVRAIAADYLEMKGAIVLTAATLKQVNMLPLDGNFPLATEQDVYEVLVNASKELCTACGKKPKRFCQQCAIALARKLDDLDGA